MAQHLVLFQPSEQVSNGSDGHGAREHPGIAYAAEAIR